MRDRLKGGRGLLWEIEIGGGGGLLCDKEEMKGFLHAMMRRRLGAGRGVMRGEVAQGEQDKEFWAKIGRAHV